MRAQAVELTERPERHFSGLGVSAGIAVGPAHVVERGLIDVPEYRIEDDAVEAEIARFHDAVALSGIADPPTAGPGRGAAGGGGRPAPPPARCAPPDALGLPARARRRDAHPGCAHQRRGGGPGAALGDCTGLRRDGGFLSRRQDRRRARGERAPRAQPDPCWLSGLLRPASRHHHHRRGDHARRYRAYGPRAHRRLRRSAWRCGGAHCNHGTLAWVAGGFGRGGPRRRRALGRHRGGGRRARWARGQPRRGDDRAARAPAPGTGAARAPARPAARGRGRIVRRCARDPAMQHRAAERAAAGAARRAPRASGSCAASSSI